MEKNVEKKVFFQNISSDKPMIYDTTFAEKYLKKEPVNTAALIVHNANIITEKKTVLKLDLFDDEFFLSSLYTGSTGKPSRGTFDDYDIKIEKTFQNPYKLHDNYTQHRVEGTLIFSMESILNNSWFKTSSSFIVGFFILSDSSVLGIIKKLNSTLHLIDREDNLTTLGKLLFNNIKQLRVRFNLLYPVVKNVILEPNLENFKILLKTGGALVLEASVFYSFRNDLYSNACICTFYNDRPRKQNANLCSNKFRR
jgi:hypothetical protein